MRGPAGGRSRREAGPPLAFFVLVSCPLSVVRRVGAAALKLGVGRLVAVRPFDFRAGPFQSSNPE